MQKYHLSSVLIVSLIVSCAGTKNTPTSHEEGPDASVSPAVVEDVRRWLGPIDREGLNASVTYLNQLGEKKVFAALKVLLADPRDTRELADAFGMLCELKGDRRRFIEPAVHALANPDESVRYRAVQLLEVIGTRAEASPVVALLSDSHGGA